MPEYSRESILNLLSKSLRELRFHYTPEQIRAILHVIQEQQDEIEELHACRERLKREIVILKNAKFDKLL